MLRTALDSDPYDVRSEQRRMVAAHRRQPMGISMVAVRRMLSMVAETEVEMQAMRHQQVVGIFDFQEQGYHELVGQRSLQPQPTLFQ